MGAAFWVTSPTVLEAVGEPVVTVPLLGGEVVVAVVDDVSELDVDDSDAEVEDGPEEVEEPGEAEELPEVLSALLVLAAVVLALAAPPVATPAHLSGADWADCNSPGLVQAPRRQGITASVIPAKLEDMHWHAMSSMPHGEPWVMAWLIQGLAQGG